MNLGKSIFAISFALFGFNMAFAASVTIPMYLTNDGANADIGTVTATDTKYGLEFTPNLHGLPPGTHGYHVHMNPNCGDKGNAAGGHLDPAKTDAHEGPFEPGHLGDLPILIVDKDGTATLPGVAPRLKVAMILNHALMIHAGGDNYADKPQKLGGGGARIACGVIPKK